MSRLIIWILFIGMIEGWFFCFFDFLGVFFFLCDSHFLSCVVSFNYLDSFIGMIEGLVFLFFVFFWGVFFLWLFFLIFVFYFGTTKPKTISQFSTQELILKENSFFLSFLFKKKRQGLPFPPTAIQIIKLDHLFMATLHLTRNDVTILSCYGKVLFFLRIFFFEFFCIYVFFIFFKS